MTLNFSWEWYKRNRHEYKYYIVQKNLYNFKLDYLFTIGTLFVIDPYHIKTVHFFINNKHANFLEDEKKKKKKLRRQVLGTATVKQQNLTGLQTAGVILHKKSYFRLERNTTITLKGLLLTPFPSEVTACIMIGSWWPVLWLYRGSSYFKLQSKATKPVTSYRVYCMRELNEYNAYIKATVQRLSQDNICVTLPWRRICFMLSLHTFAL